MSEYEDNILLNVVNAIYYLVIDKSLMYRFSGNEPLLNQLTGNIEFLFSFRNYQRLFSLPETKKRRKIGP